MKIQWLGHSCFLMTLSNNVTVVTDPFSDDIGYKLPKIKADIVTVSHNHSDHNNLKGVRGQFKLFNETGDFIEKNIKMKGIASYHDKVKGLLRGKNIIFKFEIEGLGICHLGDLGHTLNHEQIKQIGKVDILFVPVGGKYTIDAKRANKIIKLLKPRVTIPMHYQTRELKFSLDSINKFTDNLENVSTLDKNEFEINMDNLKSYSKIIIPEYTQNFT